jgi:amidase
MSDIGRRDFLRAGIAAGALGLGARVPSAALSQAEGRGPSSEVGAAGAFELEEMTIAELQDGMRSGRFTARALAEQYLQRIREVDAAGPRLNSVIETNPDALEIAERMDRERREGRVRGPLHGIPVLIKDNIDTADRMRTSAGSLALAGSVAPRDSGVAARLREAGAVILGKTNLSEWANFRSTRSTSGWSGRGGQTRNPYVLDRNPCGSSSGSGAAPAASLAAAAVGTETDGSVVCPAATCGIVGIKPTVGLVSRAGIIPISHTQDTAGPMARTVADAAALLGVLAGADPRDAATARAAGHVQQDYTRYLDAAALRGARIGVARNYGGFSPHVDRLLDDAVAAMKSAGATVVDAPLASRGKYDDAEFEVLLYEFKADLNAYLATLPASVPHRTLADLIEFNERNAEREMPWFRQEIFVMAQKKGPLTTPAYRTALAKCRQLSRAGGIDLAMRTHRLDALVAATGNPAWPTDLVNGDHFTGGVSTPAAVAGYPHVTVPMGQLAELPVGISFFGGAWSEPRLIALAYAYEQATKHRRSPKFLATAPTSAPS